jgi:hypothetical protein
MRNRVRQAQKDKDIWNPVLSFQWIKKPATEMRPALIAQSTSKILQAPWRLGLVSRPQNPR